MYELTIMLTGIVALGGTAIGYFRSRDPFHPLIFLGPMLTYSYVLTPLLLLRSDGLWRWLPREDMAWVQVYYFFGVLAVTLGVLSAGTSVRARTGPLILAPELRQKLRLGGVFLGGVGLASFAYLIHRVGGLEEAYGRAHSSGWASSGYVREAFFWIIPALVLLLMANAGRGFRTLNTLLIAFFAAPLVFHSVVSGSRGPMFLVIITLFVGYHMMANRRPTLPTMVVVLAGTAFLILFLVVNRTELHLGATGKFKSVDAITSFVDRDNPSNEYILGSGVVIDSYRTGKYQWGARYFIKTVIRAIPHSIWPTEYEDATRFFGVSSVDMNTLGDLNNTLGWKGTSGASMGFLPDVWKQFWIFGLVLIFAIGRFYGKTWCRALSVGNFWIIVYVIIVALSIYLTQQTFQAMLFRLFFLSGGGLAVWIVFIRPTLRRLRRKAQMAQAGSRQRAPRPVHRGPQVGPYRPQAAHRRPQY